MNKLQTFIQSKPMGFLTSAEMPELIALDRLFPVLVRCGGCRFTCAAQDCAHLIACIEAGGDYVRDVSFPVGSLERAASWQPEPSREERKELQRLAQMARRAGDNATLRAISGSLSGSDCEEEWRGDADPGL